MRRLDRGEAFVEFYKRVDVELVVYHVPMKTVERFHNILNDAFRYFFGLRFIKQVSNTDSVN